jgi:hypothetical protein
MLAGLLALVGAVVVLRSFGTPYRVGRLLAATPRVSVEEAGALADSGGAHYVSVEGRIDADEPFEDEHHRPLVVRRTTLAAGTDGRLGRRWVPFETIVEAVPFVVREGLDEIRVDGRELAEGLVVVPRESVGRIGDLGERAPAELPPASPARLRIELVSAVEHAIVAGVPVRDPGGSLQMTAGLARPLIVTTLDQPEAMRVLAAGERTRPRLAAILVIAAALLLAIGAGWWFVEALATPTAALAASPQPSVGTSTDTRSSGAGPGLVGDPLFAVVAVLSIGLAAVAATLGYVRLTRRRGPS